MTTRTTLFMSWPMIHHMKPLFHAFGNRGWLGIFFFLALLVSSSMGQSRDGEIAQSNAIEIGKSDSDTTQKNADEDAAADQDEIPSATWVSLRDDGGFTARIFDIGDQAQYKLQTEGVVFLTEVSGEFQFKRPSKEGLVEFSDVQPGIHMITYIGPSRFLASAVHAITTEPGESPLFRSRIDLWCVNYGKREVDSIVLPYLTKGKGASRPEIDLEKVKVISEQQSLQDGGVAALQDVQNVPSVTLVNGAIVGRVYRPGTSDAEDRILDPLVDADLLLVSDEDSYSSQKSDDEGVFSFDAVEPGAYALLCTSSGGIAALGIVVKPEGNKVGLRTASGRLLVSQLGGGDLGLQTSPNVSFLAGQAAAMAAAGASSSSSSSAGQSGVSAGATGAIATAAAEPILSPPPASPAVPANQQ